MINKKLLVGIGIILSTLSLHALLQDGKRIPDVIEITNDTHIPVVISGKTYRPGQSAQITTDNSGIVPIRIGTEALNLRYATYDPNRDKSELFVREKHNVSDLLGIRPL